MKTYIEIMRPTVVTLSVLGVVTGAFLAGAPLNLELLIASLVALLIAGGGNAINDYVDFKVDKINKPHRPIPSGRLTRNEVGSFAFVTFMISIFLVYFLNDYMKILALLNIFIIVSYSLKLKQFPIIGNLGPSWLAASSFIFGSLLTLRIVPLVSLLFIMAFSTNMGREIIKSIEDMKGDRRFNVKTLPIVTNIVFSKFVVITFCSIAIAFSLVPYFLNMLNILYFYIVVFADLLFLLSFTYISKYPKKGQNIMKIGMFVAILAFWVGLL